MLTGQLKAEIVVQMEGIMTKLQKWSSILGAALIVLATFAATPAFAARPDSLKDVLSDSRASTTAQHTISLDQATGTVLAPAETVTVTFPSGFTVPTFVAADATFTDNGSSKTVQDAACSTTDTVRITVSGQVVTFTACTSYSGTSGSILVITLGTGASKATNHATPGTYTMTVFGTYGDSTQDTAIAVIGGVTLSATIAQTLTHTTAGATTGNCPDVTSITQTEVDTSGDATTVPFGTIANNTFYGACQKLTISTNAGSGYSTTVQTTALPTSGSNTIAKGVCDASCSDTVGAAWATNTNYGYGYCMSDSSGTPAATADGTYWISSHQCGGATPFHKTIANAGAAQPAQTIMKATAGANANAAYIRYEIAASPTQAAGAYTTTLVYISTPTF